MPGTLNPPSVLVSASSATIIQGLVSAIASNIRATSGTLSASSAISYANQLIGASSAIGTLVLQSQLNIKVSS